MKHMVLAERYECLKKIGTGGMGDVYQAHDRRLDRIVAIKILKSEYNEDDNFIRKFRRESLAAASISHPNIVSIYDVGMDEIDDVKLYYIVMEYIDGKTLKQLIREEGLLSQNLALNYLIQISEALKVAHSKNIVHRDIKSQNIMITKDNRVKVTDFGIARMAGNSTVTVTNAVMGSVHYFSPEQARGQKVDARSDIYSMGIVLYEMLTGEVPFDSENPITVALMHVQNEIPLPSELNPRVSSSVDQLFRKMTQKKPQDRYDNVSQIIEDGKAILLNKVGMGGSYNTMPTGETSTVIAGTRPNYGEPQKKRPVQRKREKPINENKKKEGNKIAGFAGVVVAILLILGLIFGVPKIKEIMSGEGDPVVMENFVGKSLEEAQEFADTNELILEVSGREPREDVAENTVLSQSIDESVELNRGDRFSVVISQSIDTVPVPDIENMSVTEAQSRLNEFELDLEIVDTEFSDRVPNDRIIRQSPESGARIERGGIVQIVVSKGQENKLTLVPNLRGVDVEKAEALLEQQGLKLGNVSEREDKSVAKGEVVWQQYESGNQIKEGTSVNIIISSGLPEPDPIVEEKSLNLNVELSDDGQSHSVEIVKVSKEGREVVETMTLDGGESVIIPVRGAVGDQFEILVDGQRLRSETVR
ncbi:Stk1 family PASTA domain-containing Ser/Thr kinase [Peptoniphilus sp. KCTC 25270]|uniref:Stk1 family PASTA domain-containing Ser/Thr kinase n=1 Tax=Peptoniphilus sp. KCTC 25270 TaxID=2897414 RepID=UPI001E496383|nr:Stk1 family PASTA domain-containing Ser/Thr kinase [Peptoniphilus sp. KCTC 25270]MCD1147110.1 Stk1 family PASTA domain-containing Ser/Thr kinase [Peptoniphilus sp. KCTC 25270]